MDTIRRWFSRKDSGSEGKYNGLVNQGATCYLNSVLQVLYMTKHFRERVTSHSSNNPETVCIDRELSELFLELQDKLACTHSIINKLQISNVHEQRDAAQLYEKVLRLTSPEASQIFHGKLTNRSTCQKCHARIEDETGFWHLPLPLGNDDDYSVERGILDFFRPSVISGDDRMYCETCDEKCDAVLECEMTHPPEVLVLLLKRFEFDYTQGKYFKICSFVDVPLVLNVQNQAYVLHAFVEHLGEQRFGRYIATIKCQYDGTWYMFDDANVTVARNQYFQMHNPTERSRTAYLLFYQKQKAAKYNGLLNLGATCYLNSILQVLFMAEDFRENVKNFVKNNPETEHIDCELNDLFSDLEKSCAYTYNIAKKLKINDVHKQRDSAEQYEKILRLSSPEASQIFHGEVKNSRICGECKAKTESTTGFWHVPLSLLDSHAGCSVYTSLQNLFHEKTQMHCRCESCDKTCDADLYCELEHQPEVLVLLMKRFEYDDEHMRNVKNNCVVEVPFTLHMPQTYKLYASVDHFGELGYGHYIATIKSKDEGGWYMFNDTSVIPYMFQEHLECYKSQSAYLLFYRKQKDAVPREEVSAPETSQVKDVVAEENTDDKEANEEEEECISNSDEVIHEKTPAKWRVQENNRSDGEDGQDSHCEISDRNTNRHSKVDGLVDLFSTMTITDDQDLTLCASKAFSNHGLREEENKSDEIAQNYKWLPVNDQMHNLQSDNCSLGACGFESLMDIGDDPMDEGRENINKSGGETFEREDYGLKCTLRGEYEKVFDGDSSLAKVTSAASVEDKSLYQPYRIHYPHNGEDFKRVEATKRFIRKESSDGVECLGVTKQGDTEILIYKPKKRQNTDEQKTHHEQSEGDVGESSDKTGFVTQV